MQSNFGPQRPPYVEFEQRAEEDRERTIATGAWAAKDVDYAIICALGSKDAVEKPAVDWLRHLDEQAQRGDYPREWAKFFREQYNAWKEGNDCDAIVNGTHVKNWPSISPAQLKMLVAARILTVEDVAAANEELLARLGMGARGLKQRAQAWLDSRNPNAEELSLLREKTVNQEGTIDTLREQMDTLVSRLRHLEKNSGSGSGDEEEVAPVKKARRA